MRGGGALGTVENAGLICIQSPSSAASPSKQDWRGEEREAELLRESLGTETKKESPNLNNKSVSSHQAFARPQSGELSGLCSIG